ncbi:MAG: hypothetical protein J6V83_04485, partial [Clostridia bacterium]|nr:hypothetical protein [Clostridia bacterium]
MKTKKLCLTVAFVIVVVLAITLFACGNEGGGKNNTDELLPTLIKVRILPQSYEFNGDEEHDVCLSLLGRTIEKFTIELVLNNPDNHEIISFKYNGKEYDSNDFDSSSTNKSVIIKNLSVEPTVKEFEVKITDIVYYYKGARQKMANLTNNVKNVKVNPTFKLTLDLSETNEGPGATLEIEHQYCQ